MTAALSRYIAYVQGIVQAHETAPTFIFGNSERVLRVQAEGVAYPIVVLAWPDAEKDEEGRVQFTADLFLVDYAENEQAQEDAALLRMFSMASDLDARMRHDSSQGIITYAKKTAFQPKHRWTGDNTAGYVIEADITLNDASCYDAAKFPN